MTRPPPGAYTAAMIQRTASATAAGSALLVLGRIEFTQSLLPGIGGFGLSLFYNALGRLFLSGRLAAVAALS